MENQQECIARTSELELKAVKVVKPLSRMVLLPAREYGRAYFTQVLSPNVPNSPGLFGIYHQNLIISFQPFEKSL